MDLKFLLYFFVIFITKTLTLDEEKVSVWVVTGGRADLPCQPRPKIKNDQPQLVLWYRSSYTLPIYSYDGRVGDFSSGVRWADESALGGRAYFSALSEPPGLVLEPVHEYDEGLYTCRVDYRVSPSTTAVVNLTVVIPPGPPMIFWGGRAVVGVVGPLREEERTELSCRSVGGRPLPRLSWWNNGQRLPLLMVNSTSDPVTGTYAVEARLSVTAKRDLQGVYLTCHTQTPVDSDVRKVTLLQPRTVAVMLNITLSPVEVRILEPEEVIATEGSTVSLVCRAIGSHPPAELTWWRGRNPLTPHTTYAIEDGGNITTATLTLTLSRADDGTKLSCSGMNPALPQQPQTDSTKLVVHYAPVVGLSLGSALDPNTIKEGEDAYFECHIEANPRFHRVDWFHNGVELIHNMSAGVVMSGLSLVLRNLHRKYSGSYTCTAASVEGRTTSNAVHLTVRHAPVCAGSNKQRTLGAARGAATSVKCTAEAEPSNDITWIWTRLHEDGNEQEVSGNFIRNDGITSIINITPQQQEDYGVFQCYATNAVGRQRVACAIKLVPAGPPDRPSNCSAMPLESDDGREEEGASLAISCLEGFDGGLPQHFQLQAWQDGDLVTNLTSQFPEWVLDGVRAGTGVTLSIAAHNARGSSDALDMEVHTTNAQHRAAPGVELPLELSLLLGAIAGVFGVLLLLLLMCILVTRKVRKKPHKPTEDLPMTPTITDSFDPDVVQSIYRRPPSLDVLPCVTGEESNGEDESLHSKSETCAFVHSCSDPIAQSQSDEHSENHSEFQGQSNECTCNQRQYTREPSSQGASRQRQDPSSNQSPSDDSGVSESESDSELKELVSERQVATLFQKGDGRTYIAFPAESIKPQASSSMELRELEIQPSSSATIAGDASAPDDFQPKAINSRGKPFPKSSEELRLLPSSQREMRIVKLPRELSHLPLSTQDLRAVQSPSNSSLELICLPISPGTSTVTQSSAKHKDRSDKKSKGIKTIVHPVSTKDIHFVSISHENQGGKSSKTENSQKKPSYNQTSPVSGDQRGVVISKTSPHKEDRSSPVKNSKGKIMSSSQVSTPASPPLSSVNYKNIKLASIIAKESSV